MMTSVKHPAKFSPQILDAIRAHPLFPEEGTIIDPFAGVGGIHYLSSDKIKTIGIEIERPWYLEGLKHGPMVHWDSTRINMLYQRRSFDAMVTSPTYGNRFADHHRAKDGSVRRSYTHDLRSSVDPDYELNKYNTGLYHESDQRYWHLHKIVWFRMWEVLKVGAPAFVNVSDFIRNGERVPVVEKHLKILSEWFRLVDRMEIPTRRMRMGENSAARVDSEAVLVLTARQPVLESRKSFGIGPS